MMNATAENPPIAPRPSHAARPAKPCSAPAAGIFGWKGGGDLRDCPDRKAPARPYLRD